MRVLVTGAAGLIGSEAVTALGRVGDEVVAIVRRAPTAAGPLPPASVIDLAGEHATRALAALRPELIVHTAAVLPSRYLGDEAERVAQRNRSIDDAVFAAARSAGCRLIYISGTSLYGCVQAVSSEESPLDPRGPYLREKRISEERASRLPDGGIVLRVSSPYGVRQRAPTVLHTFLRLAVRGGTLLYHGSGAREQDFIAVEDVAAAIVAASRGTHNEVFNVASGRPIAMKELAGVIVGVVGRGTTRPAGIDDAEEHCRARLDITKAARILHWRPAVDLEVGIRRLAAALQDTSVHQGASQQDPSAHDR